LILFHSTKFNYLFIVVKWTITLLAVSAIFWWKFNTTRSLSLSADTDDYELLRAKKVLCHRDANILNIERYGTDAIGLHVTAKEKRTVLFSHSSSLAIGMRYPTKF
jgi:hypothetical protein